MSTTSELKAPYKGLIPYSAEDAPFFFGREHDQNIITANLLAERLTLLYGPSGVGKSSVLRAGVERHLRDLAKDNIERLGKPKYVVVFFNEWRETDPVRSLLLSVQKAVTQALGSENVEPVSLSLRFAEALFEWSKRVRGQLLIVLDQFEEYFLYHQDKDGKGTFAEEFPRAIRNLSLPANFLVSFREDAFSKMAFFKLRMPDLFGNYLPIDHLDRDAGRDAITKPIDEYNRQLANGGGPFSIEPALVEEVLKQVETGQVILGEAGRGMIKTGTTEVQIETPFLQMVMMRLWEEETEAGSRVLRLETLNRLANAETNETGAERIVRTHLDKVMDTLKLEKQDIAAAAFHYLVTPSGTKIAHTVLDLANYAELPLAQLSGVLEDLAAGDMRILRGVSPATDQRSEPRYEIFHDVLAAPILDWRIRHVRIQEQEEAARLADKTRVEAEKLARDEERAKSARRLRWAAWILGIMFVIAVAALVVAWNRQAAATAQAKDAVIARDEAEKARSQSERDKKLAEERSGELAALAIDLKKVTQAAITERGVAIAQTRRAKVSEAFARAAKAKTDRVLADLNTTVADDVAAADTNYQDRMEREFANQCDRKGALTTSLREFETLRTKYGALSEVAKSADNKSNEIRKLLKPLEKLSCN